MTEKNFYITTAISYVNGSPHLGHAYEAVLTDVMARFKRLEGYNVFFLTGTDEHGEKVAKTAEKNGVGAKEFADKNAAEFVAMTKLLDISQDQFIRTTEERHYRAAQAIWQTLQNNGDIYLDKYEGWYSVREEGYFTEDELLEGEGGQKLSPNGTEVEWVEEESYFFRLSAYADKLLELYEAEPGFIRPQSRMNEIRSFVKGGLKDLSISRHKSRLKWGVPVPDDDNHVMYVWLDALTNYITALGYPDKKGTEFQTFWPADYHVIGKDITRFHTIYWPAFLMAAGLALPKAVFAHGFINVQGEKMSKSVGNVLSPQALVDIFGVDGLRYFLMREITHGQDGNFSDEQAVQRINADLANGIGNLAQRTLSMVYKNCDARVPEPGPFTDDDKILLDLAHATTLAKAKEAMQSFAVHHYLEQVSALIRAADRYADDQAPWQLKKDDPARMQTVLYVLAEAVRCIAILLQPVTTEGAPAILDQLKIPADQRSFGNLSSAFQIPPKKSIDKPEGAFPRLQHEEAA